MSRAVTVRDIPGIKVIKGSLFAFTPTATPDTAQALVSNVGDGMRLWFYDERYDSPSDPGAFVNLVRSGGELRAKWENHGWSTDWVSLAFDEATAYLWSCRNDNACDKSNAIGYVGMRLERREIDVGRLADAADARRLSTYVRSRSQPNNASGPTRP